MMTAAGEDGEEEAANVSQRAAGLGIPFKIVVKRQTCVCADGGVALHRPSLHAGPGRTSGKSLGVFLPLPLADDGLAAAPVPHGLLVHRLHLLVDLNPRERHRDQPNG